GLASSPLERPGFGGATIAKVCHSEELSRASLVRICGVLLVASGTGLRDADWTRRSVHRSGGREGGRRGVRTDVASLPGIGAALVWSGTRQPRTRRDHPDALASRSP